MRTIHFLAGLPRSGSTLLAAILKQNPCFHVVVCSPVCGVVNGLLATMSDNDLPVQVTDEQRTDMCRAVVGAYYAEQQNKVVIDSHRGWCNNLAAVDTLYPDARVICCVRNPAWIVDST